MLLATAVMFPTNLDLGGEGNRTGQREKLNWYDEAEGVSISEKILELSDHLCTLELNQGTEPLNSFIDKSFDVG